MSHGVREAKSIELMKCNNLLVLVFRQTKIDNMLCRLQHGLHHSFPMQERACSAMLEMLGGHNCYCCLTCIGARHWSSECAQNHCLLLEDRGRYHLFGARSQTYNTPLYNITSAAPWGHCHVNLIFFTSWLKHTSVPPSNSVILLSLYIISCIMNYPEH